jgi:DNA gyrase subunit A
MAIRFSENNARAMGRNTSGVKGISLKKADEVVGMVVADPTATLLTVCQNGYGKRTNFGPGDELVIKDEDAAIDDDSIDQTVAEQSPNSDEPIADESPEDTAAEDNASSSKYRTQRRGGKGIIDIKTSKRNGPVVGTVAVYDNDELIMMTSRGKIQRIAANDISVIGRNTQGVRIMSLDESDTLAAIVRVPAADIEAEAARVEAEAREQAAKAPPNTPAPTSDQEGSNADEDSEDDSEE